MTQPKYTLEEYAELERIITICGRKFICRLSTAKYRWRKFI